MKDAVEAVEKRERSDDDDDEVEVEVEASSGDDAGGDDAGGEDAASGDDAEVEVEVRADAAEKKPKPDKPKAKPKVDAQAAVTEAIIKAKQELEAVLEQTQKEARTLHDKWLRAAADLQNYKKRSARERKDVVKFANEKLLNAMLPVFDDLDRTIEHMSTSPDASKETLLEGVTLVRKKFLGQLEKQGVTTFESVGTAFDPAQHEAVQQVHSDDVGLGGVAAELRRGFFLNERLLRPAMVTVSMGAPPEESTEERTTIDPNPDTDGDTAEAKASEEGDEAAGDEGEGKES